MPDDARRRRAGPASRRARWGRRCSSRSLCRAAMTSPSRTTTAPTARRRGRARARASASASVIAPASSVQRVGVDMAEGVGFEPTVGCPTHAFQACRFGRSRTPPGSADARASGHARSKLPDARLDRLSHPPGEVTVGSCATGAREPGQDREVAAFIGTARVPQIAWPSPQPAGASSALRRALRHAAATPASCGALDRRGRGRRSRRRPRRSRAVGPFQPSRRPCRPATSVVDRGDAAEQQRQLELVAAA